jgi:hypothetical protein
LGLRDTVGAIFQSLFGDAKVEQAIELTIGFRLLATLKLQEWTPKNSLPTNESKPAAR